MGHCLKTKISSLPAGVQIKDLVTHLDTRGALIELYRESWLPKQKLAPIQWNYVVSKPGTLRGVHLHRAHADYLILLQGKMLMGLRDVRTGSPTAGMACLFELNASQPQAILTPPGVMHGFYFPEQSTHIYGVNEYWNLADELQCCWNDPDLQIHWPINTAILSEKDQTAPSYKTLMAREDPFIYIDYSD